jgi:hypothetical protein
VHVSLTPLMWMTSAVSKGCVVPPLLFVNCCRCSASCFVAIVVVAADFAAGAPLPCSSLCSTYWPCVCSCQCLVALERNARLTLALIIEYRADLVHRYALTVSMQEWVLGVVKWLAECPLRDEIRHVGAPVASSDAPPTAPVMERVASELDGADANLVYAIMLRASFGGMKGDMRMMETAADAWLARLAHSDEVSNQSAGARARARTAHMHITAHRSHYPLTDTPTTPDCSALPLRAPPPSSLCSIAARVRTCHRTSLIRRTTPQIF